MLDSPPLDYSPTDYALEDLGPTDCGLTDGTLVDRSLRPANDQEVVREMRRLPASRPKGSWITCTSRVLS
jgi:hypothetical protein